MTSGHDASARKIPENLSQQTHRRVIGMLGLVLPLLLYLLAGFRPTAGLRDWEVISSVSAYYYTGGGGVFVGVLFALSLFLFTYQGYVGVSADRIVGTIGGAAALFVALYPTASPGELVAPTWWSKSTGVIHYTAAVLLFACFILFSVWLFRKSNIPKREDRPPDKRRRDDICLACGIVMIGCMLWAAAASLGGHSIFYPEGIAILAFAVSWLTKGEAHKVVLEVTERLRGSSGRH